MAKGILYIMTTPVSGVIKMGIAGDAKKYQERMRFLSSNGYGNISGLRPYFAIELENYIETESLLKDLFKFIRLGDSELYTMEADKAKQLLLTFSGSIIFPKDVASKSAQIKQIAKVRKQGELFNIYDKGIKNGDVLVFAGDPIIKVKVVGEREVEYNGVVYKLSPLALKLYTDMGKNNPSKSYRGAEHFLYKGTKLTKL